MALSDGQVETSLSDNGELFDRASRKCAKCKATVEVPAKIVWGGNAVTEYCACGGKLTRM